MTHLKKCLATKRKDQRVYKKKKKDLQLKKQNKNKLLVTLIQEMEQ